MRKLFFVLILLAFGPALQAQSVNCNLYPVGSSCRRACELYESDARRATSQGSAASQRYFDEVLAICPTFAPALREKAVPYLKRGDFATWKKLIDEAVRLKPDQNLSYRGWCRFSFLRDYHGARADLTRLLTLTNGNPGQSGNGDYDLRIVLGLCQRELGDSRAALATFDQCIAANEKLQRVGLYDYLHRGVTRLRLGDYAGALRDLELETQQNKNLADTYYYLGLVHAHRKDRARAQQNLTRARSLFLQGYGRRDPYTESLDQVYLADIDKALASLK
jgi:predicted Zn-dependent protease